MAWLLVIPIPVARMREQLRGKRFFASHANIANGNALRHAHSFGRKFSYFTCEYCFNHYVAAGVLGVAGYKLVFSDWRGYRIDLFALLWIANQYMSISNRLRLHNKREQVEIKADEQDGISESRLD